MEIRDKNKKRRNIVLFYLLSGIMGLWFVSSNWIYFWTKYMTYGQLGWVDAIGFGFALLLEIPSGAIADLLGKRKTILIGMAAGAVGILMVTFSGNLTGIFIGWLITQICFAFYSGAAEALVYDTLLELKEEEKYDRVISKSGEVESYVSAITIFLGGFLYSIDFRLPHMLWGIGFGIGSVLSYFLIEPKIDTNKFSLKNYLRQLTVGVKEILQTNIKKYIGFLVVILGGYYIYSWGFLRPAIATSFGFYEKEQAIILPILALLGALSIKIVPFLRSKISELSGLLIISAMLVAGFLLSIFNLGIWGIIPMILFALSGRFSTPWISIIVNKEIDSKNRATTLSTLALISKIPYVLVAVVAGKMIEEGRLPSLNLWSGVIILLIILLNFVRIKIQSK